jgi:hypothetical protein
MNNCVGADIIRPLTAHISEKEGNYDTK